MNISMARLIFTNINTDKVSDVTKGIAIRTIMEMETHNSITKKDMLAVIEWLWHQVFIEEGEA